LAPPGPNAEPIGRGNQRALGDLGVLGGIALDRFTVARPVCELLAHEGLGAQLSGLLRCIQVIEAIRLGAQLFGPRSL
jgi:hypothetical protein